MLNILTYVGDLLRDYILNGNMDGLGRDSSVNYNERILKLLILVYAKCLILVLQI